MNVLRSRLAAAGPPPPQRVLVSPRGLPCAGSPAPPSALVVEPFFTLPPQDWGGAIFARKVTSYAGESASRSPRSSGHEFAPATPAPGLSALGSTGACFRGLSSPPVPPLSPRPCTSACGSLRGRGSKPLCGLKPLPPKGARCGAVAPRSGRAVFFWASPESLFCRLAPCVLYVPTLFLGGLAPQPPRCV